MVFAMSSTHILSVIIPEVDLWCRRIEATCLNYLLYKNEVSARKKTSQQTRFIYLTNISTFNCSENTPSLHYL